MGREQLQGTPWHEERMHRTCKEGSTYCVYNNKGKCAYVACDSYKNNCAGKGDCMNFESRSGIPKVVSEKTIIIKQNPQNSKSGKLSGELPSLQTVRVKKHAQEKGDTVAMNDNQINVNIVSNEDDDLVNETQETYEEKFKRVSKKRIEAIVDGLRLLGNMADKPYYEYNETQIQKMFEYIDRAVQKAKDAYNKEAFIEDFKWD